MKIDVESCSRKTHSDLIYNTSSLNLILHISYASWYKDKYMRKRYTTEIAQSTVILSSYRSRDLALVEKDLFRYSCMSVHTEIRKDTFGGREKGTYE